jgi:hypothetical protein
MINFMAGAGWLFHEEGCQGGIPFSGSEEVAGSDAEVTMNQHMYILCMRSSLVCG